MKKENSFQSDLKKEILERLPGSKVMKNDPSVNAGIPDLIVLYKKKWAALECKRSKDAERTYIQERKVKLFNSMSYASFIYPENKEEVLNAMEQALGVRGDSRIHGSE